MIQVKICGLKTPEAIFAAQNAGAKFLGFVFCEKSPRNITPTQAEQLAPHCTAAKVAVTVDADDNLLDEIVKNLKPDFIQLHGNESYERAVQIKEKYNIKLIKALTPNTQHLTPQKIYDFLLFDSPQGGSGQQFDYSNFSPPSQPWFLSGGLNAANVADAIAQTGAKFVDVSSGVESQRGVKDTLKITEFLKITHAITNS